MLQYKANLDILNYRYTDLERQLLRAFIRRWNDTKKWVQSLIDDNDPWLPQEWLEDGWSPERITLQDQESMIQGGRIRIYEPMTWAFTNLLDDGLIEFRDTFRSKVLSEQESRLNSKQVELTEKGCEFILHWMAAQPLD